MSNKTIQLTNSIYEYLLSVSLREPEIFQQLRQETAKLSSSKMQIAPEQGQFMALLVELMGAKKTLELGVYTGYSALWVATALPADGKLIGCDISKEWAAIAQKFWQQAGVSHKIDLRIAPASQTLAELIANGEAETFDFVFIDADKKTYADYYEQCLILLRRGGIIVVDNVLQQGRVADSDAHDEITEAIRLFNRKIFADDRVSISMVPIGDGLTLARKR